jgi:hypothetical protein
MQPRGKVFYNSALRLDINGAITMVTIFQANKSVTNMDWKIPTKPPPRQ